MAGSVSTQRQLKNLPQGSSASAPQPNVLPPETNPSEANDTLGAMDADEIPQTTPPAKSTATSGEASEPADTQGTEKLVDNIMTYGTSNGHSSGSFCDAEASDYHFVLMPDLPQMPPDDVAFLRLQMCLQLPAKDILDEFVRHYFLHVHPLLPILDEGHFWSLYCRRLSVRSETDRMPLVLFQAMLFAACSFVPESIPVALGFPSPRAASAALYKRAKLLYDMGTESSPVPLAQAALLLTFWPVSAGVGPANPNIIWLTVAIQHAATAHSHCSLGSSTIPEPETPEGKRVRVLRRLWWCCIIRDRILSLGLRRSMQVSKTYPPLGPDDFENEVNSSLVHDVHTKRYLVRIFLRLVDLCRVLTQLLPLVSFLKDLPHEEPVGGTEEMRKLDRAEGLLAKWHSSTKKEFSTSRQAYRFRHQSVIVHSNMLYIYYHAARTSLYHQDLIGRSMVSPTGKQDPSSLRKRSMQIQDATTCITDIIQESVQLGLVRYLPVGVLAFIAMPLLYHVLDIQLQDQNGCDQEALLQHRQLSNIDQAMQQYRSRYGGVDSIRSTIHHAVDLALHSPSLQRAKGRPPGLTSLITDAPAEYLRLALTVELKLTSDSQSERCNSPLSRTDLPPDELKPADSSSDNTTAVVPNLDALEALFQNSPPELDLDLEAFAGSVITDRPPSPMFTESTLPGGLVDVARPAFTDNHASESGFPVDIASGDLQTKAIKDNAGTDFTGDNNYELQLLDGILQAEDTYIHLLKGYL